MLANMTISLIMHKRITTTVAKAKALKKYAEPLITKSKQDTTNSRRVVFSYLQDKKAVTELFSVIADRLDVDREAEVLHPRQYPRERNLDLVEQLIVGDLVDIVGKALAQSGQRVDEA